MPSLSRVLKRGFIVEHSQRLITVDQLIDKTYLKLKELDYSKGYLKKVAYSFSLFKTYAIKNEVEYYTEKLAFAFLEDYCKIFSDSDTTKFVYQERKRAIAKLDEIYKYDLISSKKLFSRKQYVFYEPFTQSIKVYLNWKQKSISNARTKSIQLYLERFSHFISNIVEIKNEKDLQIKHIIHFIESCSIYTHLTLYATVACVKQYIEFLENNHLIEDKISYFIPKILECPLFSRHKISC